MRLLRSSFLLLLVALEVGGARGEVGGEEQDAAAEAPATAQARIENLAVAVELAFRSRGAHGRWYLGASSVNAMTGISASSTPL